MLSRAPGVDFNFQDKNGDTAGLMAVRYNQEEVLKELAGETQFCSTQ